MALPLIALLALGAAGTAGAGAAIGAARRSGKKRNPLEEDAEARVIDQPNDGALMSALNYLGHLDKAKNNLLMGNFEGVGRQAVDFLGDTVDAVLPGDWIPSISRRMDKPEFSDVVGGIEPGVGKFATDVLGGIATDPLSFAPVGKIAGLAGKGASKLGGAAERVAAKIPGGIEATAGLKEGGKKFLEAANRTIANEPISPLVKKILGKALPQKANVTSAGMRQVEQITKGMTPQELEIVGDLIDNHLWDKGELIGRLGPDTESAVERMARHSGVTPENAARIQKAVEEIDAFGRRQSAEGVERGIFTPGRTSSALDKSVAANGGKIPDDAFRGDYLMRIIGGKTQDELIEEAMGKVKAGLGSPSSIDELKLTTPEATADYLKKNKGRTFERNAAVRLAKRADQQGELAKRAELGRQLLEAHRRGEIKLPPDVLEEIAKSLPPEAAAQVPPSGTFADAGKMLGGAAVEPAVVDPHGLGGFSGKSAPPTTGPIPETDLFADPYGLGKPSGKSAPPTTKPISTEPPDPLLAYGITRGSGTARPPKGESSSRLVAALLKGDLKAARKVVEQMSKGGEVDESTIRAYLNLVDEAGAAAPPVAGLADDVPDSLAAYGIGKSSGTSKPPKTGIIDDSPADPLGAYGLTRPSGTSRPPQTEPIPETNLFDDTYGIGQGKISGKASPPLTGAIDETIADPYGIGRQSGKAQPPLTPKETLPTPGATPAELDRATKHVLGKDFALVDPESDKLVKGLIRGIAAEDPVSARALLTQLQGLPPRAPLMQMIANVNRIWKPYVTAGLFMPKWAFSVRNKITSIVQTASNPRTRKFALAQARPSRAFGDLWGSLADAAGFKNLAKGELDNMLHAYEDALDASGGVSKNALQILAKTHPEAAELIGAGVIDGFARSEDLLRELGRSKNAQKAWKFANWPMKFVRGVEDRMRLGLALDMRRANKAAPVEQIVDDVGDSLFKYDMTSTENRFARDLLPFAQYPMKAGVQTAKLFAEQPAVAAGIGHALNSAQDPDTPIYPYMEGKLNVPLGTDAQGNQSFATGFGLPFESLNMIPTSFRDVKRNVIGASSPALKTAYGLVTGEDPYFESPFGQYDKVPLAGNAGDLGRGYNLLTGAGLNPVDAPLRQLDKALNADRSVPIRALDLLTGANVVTVDPDRALQQQLQAKLKASPDVAQYRGFYNRSKDPQAQALLEAYNGAKARAKAKRQGAMALPPQPGEDPGSL